MSWNTRCIHYSVQPKASTRREWKGYIKRPSTLNTCSKASPHTDSLFVLAVTHFAYHFHPQCFPSIITVCLRLDCTFCALVFCSSAALVLALWVHSLKYCSLSNLRFSVGVSPFLAFSALNGYILVGKIVQMFLTPLAAHYSANIFHATLSSSESLSLSYVCLFFLINL